MPCLLRSISSFKRQGFSFFSHSHDLLLLIVRIVSFSLLLSVSFSLSLFFFLSLNNLLVLVFACLDIPLTCWIVFHNCSFLPFRSTPAPRLGKKRATFYCVFCNSAPLLFDSPARCAQWRALWPCFQCVFRLFPELPQSCVFVPSFILLPTIREIRAHTSFR